MILHLVTLAISYEEINHYYTGAIPYLEWYAFLCTTTVLQQN